MSFHVRKTKDYERAGFYIQWRVMDEWDRDCVYRLPRIYPTEEKAQEVIDLLEPERE